jgi:hypothetical protein
MVLVLQEDGRYDMDRLIRQSGPDVTVVLSPMIPWKKRAWLRGWCAEHDVPVHDIREQGAYVRAL